MDVLRRLPKLNDFLNRAFSCYFYGMHMAIVGVDISSHPTVGKYFMATEKIDACVRKENFPQYVLKRSGKNSESTFTSKKLSTETTRLCPVGVPSS